MCSLVILFTFISCTDESIDVDIPPYTVPFETGHTFRKVSFQHENEPLVNRINPPEFVHAEHYVFKSPSHNNQEIGFSMVTSQSFNKGNNKVFVFLHGQGGHEGAGFSQYIPYLAQSGDIQDDAVYLLLNGITANGGSWKIKDEYNPIQAVGECLAGLMESEAFSHLSSDPDDWTVIGFSMGGRAAMGIALNPEFLDWHRIPHNIFPMGSWLSVENMNEMIDFSATINDLESHFSRGLNISVINHVLDRGGDNSLSLKADVSDLFLQNLNSNGFDIPNFHLSEPRAGCTSEAPQIDDCNVHVLQFYLQHMVGSSSTVSQFVHLLL